MNTWRASLHGRFTTLSRTPSMTLLRLFIGRIFHGGDAGADELDVGVTVILIFLALPGTLVSLLMFEKYGSLIRFLRGDRVFDPYLATIPDEYFFIVLSMAVTGAAVLWRWDSLFLDRRDYTNLVPLPIPLRRIFLANLAAIFTLTATLTIVVNAASFLLFPIAVQGSQNSFSKLVRFAWGHAASVTFASLFSFLAILAISGTLLALLPYSVFRRISIFVRFLLALCLLAMLASSFTAASLFSSASQVSRSQLGALPPVWFIGITETLWTGSKDAFFTAMFHRATAALAITFLLSVAVYSFSFRRSFIRIPETADVGPLPRVRAFRFPGAVLDATLLRALHLRACYHFVSRTLMRSEAHLQVVFSFAAIGTVVAVENLQDAFRCRPEADCVAPGSDLLGIPFILGFCILVGIRIAFAIPADLRANWLFRLWIDSADDIPRSVARQILIIHTLSWLLPLCFLYSVWLWSWRIALLHTVVVAGCFVSLIEVLIVRLRKIPFTCPYPAFQSHSALIGVAGLFGFLGFAIYLPEFEQWALADLWRVSFFVPLIAAVLVSVRQYRKQMLDMDKQLIFEEVAPSGF
jgi:hypothetical protein